MNLWHPGCCVPNMNFWYPGCGVPNIYLFLMFALYYGIYFLFNCTNMSGRRVYWHYLNKKQTTPIVYLCAILTKEIVHLDRQENVTLDILDIFEAYWHTFLGLKKQTTSIVYPYAVFKRMLRSKYEFMAPGMLHSK